MVDKIEFGSSPVLNKPQGPASKASQAFDQVLDRTLTSQSTGQTGPTGLNPPAVSAMPGVEITGPRSPLARVDTTLDLLDRLANRLRDPRVTPKAMSPLMEELNREADELLALADRLPAGAESRNIARKAATLVKVQVAKFERGEFI